MRVIAQFQAAFDTLNPAEDFQHQIFNVLGHSVNQLHQGGE